MQTIRQYGFLIIYQNIVVIMKDNKIDILFIDGFHSGKEKIYYLGFVFPISSVLEKAGYTHKILNLQLLKEYSLQELVTEIRLHDIRCIGFSTNADNIKYVYKTVNSLKNEFPDLPIILGGPQATFDDERILKNCKADVVIRHEGEYKLLKLLDYFIRNIGCISKIKGITYKIENGIIRNPEDELIDLDELPSPNFDILSNKTYWLFPEYVSESIILDFMIDMNRANNIYVGSRGCPYNCIFCIEGNLKQKHRMRSPENIYKDLDNLLKNTKAKKIIFGDDTFTASSKRITEMCAILKRLREKYDFIWFAEGRVDVLAKNPELIRLMVEAGMDTLQVGIESGCQKILDIQNKKITLDQIRTVFREIGNIKEPYVMITGNVILGGPGETVDTLAETQSFVEELYKLADFRASITESFLVPFKGTPISENPDKFKIHILDPDFEHEADSFREILTLPYELDYYDLYKFWISYKQELQRFFHDEIYSLDKSNIDSIFRMYNFYVNNYNASLIIIPYTSTVLTTLSLDLYYKTFFNDAIIKKLDIIDEYVFPVRLWNLEYDNVKHCYLFTTLNGEEMIISGNKMYLWEMATGNNTIRDILTDERSPYPYNSITVSNVIEFYNDLYENFVLIYSEI